MNIAEILGISSVSDVNVTNQTENVENTNEDFASYLNASTTTMDDIFNKASETYQVPVALLKAMAKQESNFDPNATSSSGAQGVMQLMPATAASLGVTNAYDPEQNIMGGAKYISQLLDKYDGDTTLALAAYNAGMGNVAKYGGVPPFKETQNYVAKVTAYMNENLTIDETNNQISSADFLSALDNNDYDERVQSLLEQIFSYEDYMRFLELFLEQMTAINTSFQKFCEAKFVSMPISPALLFKRKSSSVGTYAAVTVSIQVSFSLILITILRKSDSRINDSIENIHYQHNDNVHCRIYKAQ